MTTPDNYCSPGDLTWDAFLCGNAFIRLVPGKRQLGDARHPSRARTGLSTSAIPAAGTTPRSIRSIGTM